MKHLLFKTFPVLVLAGALCITSCKGKDKKTGGSDTTSTVMQPPDTVTASPMPVQVSPDDSLTAMAKDATKDFPSVTAAVNNGEITLTGNITRDKLPKLMMALNAMHPKKINNNLTIK